jgi:hypothetical protein
MGEYVINQESVDKIHEVFRKEILKDNEVEWNNEFIPAHQVKKIKSEISRLKFILRECRPNDAEFYQEIIEILQSKIKK